MNADDYLTLRQVSIALDLKEERVLTLYRVGSLIGLALGRELLFPKWQFLKRPMRKLAYSSGLSDILVRWRYHDELHSWDIEEAYRAAKPVDGETPTATLRRARVPVLCA